MERRELAEGDLVQLKTCIKSNPMFGGCMIVVTELWEWGAVGYVQTLENRRAYFSAKWEDMEYVLKGMEWG